MHKLNTSQNNSNSNNTAINIRQREGGEKGTHYINMDLSFDLDLV